MNHDPQYLPPGPFPKGRTGPMSTVIYSAWSSIDDVIDELEEKNLYPFSREDGCRNSTREGVVAFLQWMVADDAQVGFTDDGQLYIRVPVKIKRKKISPATCR